MKINSCPLCRSKNIKILWNDKIRIGKKFSKKKYEILKCINCDVGYLKDRQSFLEDNKIFRKIFDGDNSVLKYQSFNRPREIKKIKKIQNLINFKNKSVLESNCGAASILDYLKKDAKLTAGLDSSIYRSHVEKKHLFFSNLDDLRVSKYKFDLIISLAELEHKKNPLNFIRQLKKNLKAKGKIIFRVPNFNNIYMYLIGIDFLRFDFRLSHNFYFNEKSLDYIFKKLNMKVVYKGGLQEYNINHLIEYMKIGKRVKGLYEEIIPKRKFKVIEKNIERHMLSTSLLYIVSLK